MVHGRFVDGVFLQRQKGVVLLSLLLVLISIAACLHFNKLHINLLLAVQEYRTEAILNQAREALIGYAASYPDKINPDYGPGYLPCPDRDNNGATDPGACSLSGHTSIGRFPYKTLEQERLRDGQGETLWYVVADNFRNNPKREPLNSDTRGNLTVDGIDDIVAIIAAPGKPLPSQNRSTEPNTVANYLEGENADFDTAFLTHGGDISNDRLVFITRQELMQVVERRVLREISWRLGKYQSVYNAFPWLSPFLNPALSEFHSQLDTNVIPKKGWQGHIAFHPFYWATNPSRMSGSNPFPTDIHWSWSNIQNAIVNSSGTVDITCIVNLDCVTGPMQGITSLESATQVPCTWTERNTVDCATTIIIRSASYTHPSATGCTAGTLERTYTINFPPYTGMITVHGPTAQTYRTRDVILNGAIPPMNDAIQITDVYRGPLSASCTNGSIVTGTGSMSFTAGTIGMLSSNNIHYDLDVKYGELPEWIFKNDWHTLIYLAYAEAEAMPGSSSDICVATENCLVLEGAGYPYNRNRALALIAGSTLSDMLRPSAQITAYFESANSIIDERFEQSKPTAIFNDQVTVISVP